MQKTTITIEQLAEKLGGNLWTKGDLKRIYLDRGHNTKKMSTKTFVWQDETGDFKVSCKIDCPSQPWEWISSQQDQVIDSVMEDIEEALSDTVYILTNKEGRYVNYKGEEVSLNDSENYLTEGKAKEEIDNCAGYSSYITMPRAAFDAEVARLEEIERPIREKVAAEQEAARLKAAEEKKAEDDKKPKKYTMGMKVKHAKFGEGTVITTTEGLVEVDFSGDVRKLITDYVELEIVGL